MKKEEIVKKSMKDLSFKSLAPLEAYYIVHKCFMPKNYILKNAKKIANIPLGIVHGRYDMICIPKMAYKLHKAIPKSKLWFVAGGHSNSERAVQEKLLEETEKYWKKPKKWPY